MDKKRKKVIIISIILIVIIIICFTIYQKSKNFITPFTTDVSQVYFTITKEYNTKYELNVYAKIDGESCNEANPIWTSDGTDYYVELDDLGNVKKMLVSNKKYKYVNDNMNKNYTDLYEPMDPNEMEKYISKSKGFKFDCEGNILSR